MAFELPSSTTAALLVFLSVIVIRILRIGSRESYLPPGPPTRPILGNLHIFPQKDPHFQFAAWAQEYGKIYSLKLSGNSVVVLTDPEMINALLEKSSALTSDRPNLHFAEVVTGGLSLTLAHYTDTWRSIRRGSHEILSPQSCRRILPIQQAEATQLSYDLLSHPEDFSASIKRYALSVMFSVLFGKRVPRHNSPLAKQFYKMMHSWTNLLAPGAHPPVDMIPILKYVPERFAAWKTQAKEVRRTQREIYFGLLNEVRDRKANVQENGSFLETVIDRADEWNLNEERIGYLGGVMIEGGADTTSAFLQTLVLLLTAHPEVQVKAQKEIDAVVGNERMPTLDDIENLPYVRAIILETHRSRPITPLNFPHVALQDLTYNGYVIPKGTAIYANAWGVYHDPDLWEDPDRFYPDRFLGKNGPELEKVMNLAFGNGRRSCPGIHLARNAVNLNTMNILWGFNIAAPLDKDGKELPVDTYNYAVAVSYSPNPFKNRITSRSPRHGDLIRQQLASYTEAFEQFEHLIEGEDKKHIDEFRQNLLSSVMAA